MYTLSGLGSGGYGDCIAVCDTIDPHAFLKADLSFDSDAYGAFLTTCYGSCAGMPATQGVTSTLPGALPGAPGYQSSPPTNWWRVGAALGIGLVAAGALFFVGGRISHAR